MRDERAHLQLFDLIAREWQLPSPGAQVLFNATNTAVAFGCEDGSIHLASTSDTSSPNQRTRRALDSGRVTIAPRQGSVSPLKRADHTDGRSSTINQSGRNNFVFAKDNGRLNTLTPGGLSTHLPQRAPGSVAAVAVRPDAGATAFACGQSVYLVGAADDQTLSHAGTVNALAWNPGGTRLAVAHGAGVTLWTMAVPAASKAIAVDTAVVDLVWSDDGVHLAALLASDGFCLIAGDGADMRHFGSFPAAVRSVGFNLPRQTIVASGAFRPAAWSLTSGENLISGKSGLTLIDAVAACPTRNLIAVGYANGLVSLAEIGQSTEILLRENTGAAIRGIAWSGCGKFLALAGADGSAALVEFPDAMFKPMGE